jgi:hypothetical protein
MQFNVERRLKLSDEEIKANIRAALSNGPVTFLTLRAGVEQFGGCGNERLARLRREVEQEGRAAPERLAADELGTALPGAVLRAWEQMAMSISTAVQDARRAERSAADAAVLRYQQELEAERTAFEVNVGSADRESVELLNALDEARRRIDELTTRCDSLRLEAGVNAAALAEAQAERDPLLGALREVREELAAARAERNTTRQALDAFAVAHAALAARVPKRAARPRRSAKVNGREAKPRVSGERAAPGPRTARPRR